MALPAPEVETISLSVGGLNGDIEGKADPSGSTGRRLLDTIGLSVLTARLFIVTNLVHIDVGGLAGIPTGG